MLTIFILLALGIGFYTGYRRGLIMQAVRLIGYIITFVIAINFYEPLSEIVELFIPFPAVQPNSNLALYNEAQSFLLDQVFYRAITFVLIWIIGGLLTNFIAIFFTRLSYYDFFKYINYIGGGIINLLITYAVIFMFLFILSLIPIEFIQQQFVDNPFAFWMVDRTPFLSDFANEAWFNVNPLGYISPWLFNL